MRRLIFLLSVGIFVGVFHAWAQMEEFDIQNSVILEVGGHACMGNVEAKVKQ